MSIFTNQKGTQARLTYHLESRLASLHADKNDMLVVGCSGGVDSMTLLACLLDVHPRERITVAHLDHALRSDSHDDAEFVRRWCEREGVRCVCERMDITERAEKSKQSIEEAGRSARYEFFESVRKKYGESAKILTAHHADDAAETVLYRLARGTTIHGLVAIEESTTLIRPFLDISRSAIESEARSRGLDWREDPTNADTAYARNRIRHEVIPVLNRVHPEATRSIARFSRYAEECSRYISWQTQKFLGDTGFFFVSEFSRESDFFQREIIRTLYEHAHTGSTAGLSEANIWEILRFIYNPGNPTEKTLGNLTLRKSADRVYHRPVPIPKIVPMNQKSIFTRIIEGELPCYRVYEDEHVFAFLDIHPVALWHVLVVPKVQVDEFQDVPESYASALFLASQRIAKAIKHATGCRRVGMLIAGFDVPHTHLHVFPANSNKDIPHPWSIEIDEATMEAMRKKIEESV